MDDLISFQNNLLTSVNDLWFRYLFPELNKPERLLGLKGLRGVGKTTLMLQYLRYGYPEKERALYVTADHPYFYRNTLLDLAGEWHRYDGNLMLIDEVHKYPDWSRELKLIHDGYPGMKVIFTSSSALDLYRGESDLSRRLITHDLFGLSFREYLDFIHQIRLEPLTLEVILKNHPEIAKDITGKFKPLPLFKQYLREGYFPYAREINKENLMPSLLRIINTVLESDLAYSHDYSAGNTIKIKKLLGVIAASAPFQPNILKIAERLQLGRNTVNQYLRDLEDARILRLLNKPARGISHLQKPDKIYFENTAFSHAFQNTPDPGTLRETFFLNQVHNAGHTIHLHEKADFLVDELFIFEVGGRNKNTEQIRGLDNSWLVMDDIETGFKNRIPLWLFGMLY
jgi:hypothetical protein